MFRLSQLTRHFDAALRDVVNDNAAVRASAARDLAHQSDDHRAGAIRALETALSDKDASVRAAAAEALGDLHAVDALDALLSGVEDPDAGVRQQAIGALGELRDARAADRLERALGDPRPEVRFQAVMAFSRVSPSRKAALDALVDATGDRDEYVAHIAFRMAEEVADEMGGGLDGRIVERAVLALDHASPRVRAVAAVVVTSAEDERGHAALVSVIDGTIATPESEDLTAAIELAGERGIEEAIPALERRAFGGVLGFGRDPFAWHARTALARMGHARAMEEIVRDLSSLSHHKRTLAVAAAGRARLKKARGLIVAMKGDPKRAAQSAVESALAMLDEPSTRSAARVGAVE